MKTLLKNGLVAIAIATSLAACQGKGSAAVDSVKTDSSSVTTMTDTLKKDTSSMTPDSLKKDTNVKTTTTEVKTNSTQVKKKP